MGAQRVFSILPLRGKGMGRVPNPPIIGRDAILI